jgi:hypothetical protein
MQPRILAPTLIAAFLLPTLAAGSLPAVIADADTFDADTIAAGIWDVGFWHTARTVGDSASISLGQLHLDTSTSGSGIAVTKPVTLSPTGATLEALVVGHSIHRYGLTFAQGHDRWFSLEFDNEGFCLCYHTASGYWVTSFFAAPGVPEQPYVMRLSIASDGTLTGEVLDAVGASLGSLSATSTFQPANVTDMYVGAWSDGPASSYSTDHVTLAPRGSA